MKTNPTTKERLLAELSAKESLLYALPEPRTIYTDLVKYCEVNCYKFDPDSLEDPETREYKQRQMDDDNLKNELFNQYLAEMINILRSK